LTKIFIARPDVQPQPLTTPPHGYGLSPEARALMLKGANIEDPLTYDIPGKGLYAMTGGSSFDFEVNILDSSLKLPVRAVEIESGLVKGYTDRLGRLILHLPRGRNKVTVSGFGFVEEGNFTPKRVDFDPIVLEVDIDSDEIVTLYTSGEIVKGERHALGNPGHGRGHSSNLESFLREYGWALGIIGITGVAAYYFGKSRNHAH